MGFEKFRLILKRLFVLRRGVCICSRVMGVLGAIIHFNGLETLARWDLTNGRGE